MFPFDITTLFLIVGLTAGLIATDAAFYGDTLTLHINVSPKIVQTGFDTAGAEQIFTAESARIIEGESIIPAPTLRVSSRPTVIAALATPLNLQSPVNALQDQLGLDRLEVNANLMSGDDKALRMLIVVKQAHQTPEQIQLTQIDGDAAALVRRGAALTMARVSPYRVAQAEFIRGVHDDPPALKEARETIMRYLVKPWDPSQASERAMLYNLLALLAMIDGELPVAESQLVLVDPIPGVVPAARGLVALNRSFLAIAGKRPADALALFQDGEKQAVNLNLPNVNARITMLHALVMWSAGDLDQAEKLLRVAIATMPTDEGPHTYLSQLLAGKGDTDGAEKEKQAAITSHPFDVELPVFAQSIFWVDPVNGGLKRR